MKTKTSQIRQNRRQRYQWLQSRQFKSRRWFYQGETQTHSTSDFFIHFSYFSSQEQTNSTVKTIQSCSPFHRTPCKSRLAKWFSPMKHIQGRFCELLRQCRVATFPCLHHLLRARSLKAADT